MKTRHFVGSTHHEAMRQVRLALGADALIVASRRSKVGVEIIAADESATSVFPPIAPAGEGASKRRERVETDPPDVIAAIDGLRGMLESRIDTMAWDARLKRAPASAALFQTLLAAGFSTALAHTLLTRLPADLTHAQAMVWVRNELLTRLPVQTREDALWGEGGVFALVGPTGVGKTTTVAKLAARCAARLGAHRVAMLTTDSYRIGAYEQLQIYGRLMQVPVHGARDSAELRQTLAQLGERDLILIDNVGLSQRDRQVAEQAAMLCTAGQRVRRLLVMNAASHGDTLDEVARAYQGDGDGEGSQALQGCILTKLDEAPRLGAVLDTAIRYRLPVHYTSHGQKVPEDLRLADAAALLDRALVQTQESPALYAPNESDLGALWGAAHSDARASAPPSASDPRRRQLLLSALNAGGADTADVDQALDWLQHEPVMALTRVLLDPQTDFDALSSRVHQAVCAAFAPRCQSHVLAVHGATPLKTGGAGTARLLSAVLLSDRGTAIAAPYQQWLNAQMCLASWPGQAQEDSLCVSAALRARVASVGADYPQLPLVHLLGGGAAGLWQSLAQTGVAWVSKIGAAARVVLDDGATTAQALARNLAHTPVPTPSVALTVWAGETTVRTRVRDAATLRLVSVRVIDSASGAVTARLYGLSNLAVDQAPTACLASWLVQQNAAKSAFRFMAPAWQAVAHQAGGTDMRRQALLAGQLGLASWHIAHTPSAQALRRVLGNLAGSKAAAAQPGALLHLFALLDMAES